MLLNTLRKLRDLGNTLLVVEHDEDTMRAADFIVDVGPGAGIHGGEIVATGTAEDIMACPKSITGAVPLRPQEDPRSRYTPNGQRPFSDHSGRGREQSEKHRRLHSAGHLHCGHRRVRLRQVQSGQRDHL